MRRPISSMTDEEIKTLYKILGFGNTYNYESSPEYCKLYNSIKNNTIIIPESSYSIDEIGKMIDWLDSNYFDRGKDVNYINHEISELLKEKGCDCLNIYEVCRWIKKNYDLYIYATYEEGRGFQSNIKSLITGKLYITNVYNDYEDPKPVLEEAIKYCLKNNLI